MRISVAIGERVRAVHAFNMGPNQHEYLVFDENDLIEVLELGHDGWWKVRPSSFTVDRIFLFRVG
jgi:hypothetical protein